MRNQLPLVGFEVLGHEAAILWSAYGSVSLDKVYVKRAYVCLWSFSLSVAIFSYGFAASQFKLFPYTQLKSAYVALHALVGLAGGDEVNGLERYRLNVSQPTAISHSGELSDELILIAAKSSDLLAWVIDRDGQVIHRWDKPTGLWDRLEVVTSVPGISGDINPAALHLFPNGDLLATFHGFNTFPFAIGMAKFDRNSRLIWKKELLTHHSFSVSEEGNILVPALEVIGSPMKIGETFAVVQSETGKIYQDLILILDQSGNVLKKIVLKDALFNSGWNGHLIHANSAVTITDDPFHLNDVRLIGSASKFLPELKSSDVLVSMRNINALGILDPDTERFKWMFSGGTVGQHSPRVVNRSILVLDNLGGDQSLGGTQLVSVDFQTGLPTTIFPVDRNRMPDLCRTVNSGYLDIHSTEQFALMTLSHEGAVWEIDLQKGEVVWEFIYANPKTGKRELVGSAQYVVNGFLTET
jgi:hypothetical protein